MILQAKIKVIKNIAVGQGYYKIVLSSPRFAHSAKPGQFLEIKVSDTCEPLLRRPLGIHRIIDANIEILYEVVGQGTEILAQKKAGEFLDIIGPLGNGYSTLNTQYSILIAGGMGVAPLVFLAEKLVKSQVTSHKSQVKVLIGAQTKGRILCEKEFKDLGCEVKIATDDGSRGFKGKVTGLLKHLLRTPMVRLRPFDSLRSLRASLSVVEGRSPSALSEVEVPNSELRTIYACGPRPMLKEISHISQKYHIPAQISLEEHMACGIGACLGCVVKTLDGYKRVCKEGPVFAAQEIVW